MEDNLKVNEAVMDNVQKKKGKSFPIIIISLIALLCVAVFGILCGTGVMPVPVGNGQLVDIDTAKLIKNASNVQDEEALRQLLLLDMELDITVTKDMKVKEGFLVYGKKTLQGDATILADIFGKFEETNIFTIQKGASLTVDGLVIDGNGLADGFCVSQKAELTYLSGTVQKVSHGIVTNGLVTIEDINLHTIGEYGIHALFKSDVYLNGGKIYNSGVSLLYVDSMSNVEMREGFELFGSRSYIISNVGNLKIYGGTISTSYHGAGIHNQGKLEMDYQGEAADGMITITDTAAAAIIMDSNQDGYISDVQTSNIGKNGVWVSDLKAKGALKIENCIFDGTGMAAGDASALSLTGKVDVKDVVITNATDEGFYIRKDAQVKLENISLDKTKGVALNIYGGKVEAKNITLKNVGYGVSLGVDGNFVGTANIEGLTISGAKKNNIQLYKGAKVRVKDAVLEKSVRTSIYTAKETEVELENVHVKGVTDPGLFCLEVREDAKVTILGDTVITGGTSRAMAIFEGSVLTMKSGVVKDISSTGSGAAIYIDKGATFNLLGGTITNNYSTGSGGAVYVAYEGTFNMKGGTISNNKSEKNGGGGVQLQGTMNFSGGTIKNNISGSYGGGINVARNGSAKTHGTLNMTGGTITGNKTKSVGGGILVCQTAIANISGGTISNNSCVGLGSVSGDGIYIEGNLTISDKIYLEKDVITLATSSIVLNIKGNSLSKHNASNPLLVGVARGTTLGKVVVQGDSEHAITSLLSHVASGNRAYTLCQNEKDAKTMTVTINKADMDMTGADKVYVTNFEELRDAVETTTSKRFVIVGADIVFESDVVVPDGTTVYIRDDGQPRTFSRAEGHISQYFKTYYGTGLYLVGTSYGNLKLDGTLSGDADVKDVSAFMDVRGTTEIRNVAFENNKSLRSGKCGSFICHEYGETNIYSSTFKEGLASYGGAIYLGEGHMLLDDCIFEQNEGTKNGGAVCVYNDGNLAVTGTKFQDNTAKAGGAVYVYTKGKLAVADTTFQGNTVKDDGGAICAYGPFEIEGEGTFDSNSAQNGGAIYASNENTFKITGQTFKNNSVAYGGGAICFWNTSAEGATISDSHFIGNNAVTGGAIYNHKNLTINDGSTFSDNAATDDGGAIITSNGELKLEGISFKNNSSSASGGAIFISDNGNVSSMHKCTFIGNEAGTDGGAIGTVAGSGATISNGIVKSKFTENKADYRGGAIYYRADPSVTLVIDSCEFSENEVTAASGRTYTAGGAVWINRPVEIKGAGKFENNKCLVNGDGGAILLAGATTECSITGQTFENNSAAYGAAICNNDENLKGSIDTSEFINNSATVTGGAIWNAKTASISVTNAEFQGNTAISEGGAILTRGELKLEGTSFKNNTSSKAGGAVYIDNNGNVSSMNECTFTGNEAGTDGGAIATAGKESGAKISNGIVKSKFSENKADYRGGAIYYQADPSVTLVIDGCEFSKNEATAASGLTYTAGGAIWINRPIEIKGEGKFEDNKCLVGGDGGAILLAGGTTECSITGQTFKNNSADYAGAICNNDTNLKGSIDKSDFINNIATVQGRDIWNTNTASITVTNAKFQGNSAGSDAEAIFTRGNITLSNVSFSGGNKEVHLGNKSSYVGKVTISGKITDAVFVYKHADALVTVASTGIDETSTLSLTPMNYTDGAQVLGRDGDSDAAKVALAKAAQLTQVTQNETQSGVKWCNIDSEGKLCSSAIVSSNPANGDYISLVTAINEAPTGATIYVNSSESIANTIAIDKAIILKTSTEGVTLTRGNAAEMFNITSNGSLTVEGAITLDGNKSTINGTNSLIVNAGTLSLKKGVVVQNASSTTSGGAITSNGELKLEGTSFKNNSSSASGGAIYVADNGNVSCMKECTFIGNVSKTDGGAIGTAGKDSGAKISNGIVESIFNENHADSRGGAIYYQAVDTVTLVINSCEFKGNTCKSAGGAIWTNRPFEIKGEGKFENNNASNNGDGGAILATNVITCSITGQTFNNNNAGWGGALCFNNKLTCDITDCKFNSNTAITQGSAIYTKGTVNVDTLSVFNNNTSLISDNVTKGGTIIPGLYMKLDSGWSGSFDFK